MSAIRGKILFVLTCILAVVTIAGSSVGTYMLAKKYLVDYFGQSFVAIDWNMVTIVLTAVGAVLAALCTLPSVIVSAQVSGMYDVNRKSARWTPVSVILALLVLALIGAAVFGSWYLIEHELGTLLKAYLQMESLLQIEIGAGVAVTYVLGYLLLPLLVAVRMHDSVSNLRKKKRARIEEE